MAEVVRQAVHPRAPVLHDLHPAHLLHGVHSPRGAEDPAAGQLQHPAGQF